MAAQSQSLKKKRYKNRTQDQKLHGIEKYFFLFFLKKNKGISNISLKNLISCSPSKDEISEWSQMQKKSFKKELS